MIYDDSLCFNDSHCLVTKFKLLQKLKLKRVKTELSQVHFYLLKIKMCSIFLNEKLVNIDLGKNKSEGLKSINSKYATGRKVGGESNKPNGYRSFQRLISSQVILYPFSPKDRSSSLVLHPGHQGHSVVTTGRGLMQK